MGWCAGYPAMGATGMDAAASFGVNKYARGALFFQEVEKRLGREYLDTLLQEWHTQHRDAQDATIESLLEALARVDAALASQARDVLDEPSWSGEWPVRPR